MCLKEHVSVQEGKREHWLYFICSIYFYVPQINQNISLILLNFVGAGVTGLYDVSNKIRVPNFSGEG